MTHLFDMFFPVCLPTVDLSVLSLLTLRSVLLTRLPSIHLPLLLGLEAASGGDELLLEGGLLGDASGRLVHLGAAHFVVLGLVIC